MAVPRGTRTPTIDYSPVKIHRFSDLAYKSGIAEHLIDEVSVKVYNPEKTLADCFKFRNNIGMDVVLEALKYYKTRREFKPAEPLKYAKICRVEKVIRPYLEAMADKVLGMWAGCVRPCASFTFQAVPCHGLSDNLFHPGQTATIWAIQVGHRKDVYRLI